MESTKWFTLACVERADKVERAFALYVNGSMRCKDVYLQLRLKACFPDDFDVRLSCDGTPLDNPMELLQNTPASSW